MVSADDPSALVPSGATYGTDRPMLHTKSCPRCSGDLALVQDVGDAYLSCVQCGHMDYQLKSTRQQLAPATAASR
jgi:Zn ribbon nucleic-acid-binding protein